MELAQHICENLRKEYPNDSFVAYTNACKYFGRGIICDMNGTRVSHIVPSSEKEIGDSTLKSLLHRPVFGSKTERVIGRHIYLLR